MQFKNLNLDLCFDCVFRYEQNEIDYFSNVGVVQSISSTWILVERTQNVRFGEKIEDFLLFEAWAAIFT